MNADWKFNLQAVASPQQDTILKVRKWIHSERTTEEKREKLKSLIVLALHKLHYMFPESSELDIIQTQGKWPMARNPDSS